MNSEQRKRELEQTIEASRAELAALEDGTWAKLAISNAGVTPGELAKAIGGITVQAANERLKRLWRIGLVTRHAENVFAGGRQYRYRLEDESRW